MIDENYQLADVTYNGTILIGNQIVCDGFKSDRRHAAFTHIHLDHVQDVFEKALHSCQIYTTYDTQQLLEALNNDIYRTRRQYHTLDVEPPNNTRIIGDEGEKLTLLPSAHMLGACQVHVTTPNGVSIGYSGDFTDEDTPPICDILVIDATHGSPQFNKKNTNEESLGRRLVDIVEEKFLNESRTVVIHAHRGRLQEVMSLVSKSKEIPRPAKFFTTKRDVDVADVYRKRNFTMRDILVADTDDNTDFRYDAKYPFIEFLPSSIQRSYEENHEAYSIYLRDYLGEYDCKEYYTHTSFVTKDHATFDGIIDYVKRSGAKKIIVENTRTKQGKKLAKKLNEIKDVEAICRPEKQQK